MIDQPYRMILTLKDKGQTLTTLVKGALLVGRSDAESNHIPDLDLKPLGAWNAGVSRRHLVMNPFDETTFFIKDLGSANGTRINGGLLKAGMVYSLHSGDLLTVGTLHLIVVFNPATTAEIEALKNGSTGILLGHVYDTSGNSVGGGQGEVENEPNTTIVQRSGSLREDLLEAVARANHLTPDEREAVTLLKQIVTHQDLSEDVTFYIARDAIRNPYWRSNRRIAVLQAASTYGYIRRDHPELVQEQQRLNQQRTGRAD